MKFKLSIWKICTILVMILICSVTSKVITTNASVLTPNPQVINNNYSWVYDGQKYYDLNGKEKSFNEGLPEICKTDANQKACKNFKWVIFTTNEEAVVEKKNGFKNTYSGIIYSTLEEALKDKQMLIVIENSKKRLTLEEKIHKELEANVQNQNNFFVNMILVFGLGFLIIISALIYFWVHNKHILKNDQKIKLEVFYPKNSK